MLGQVVAVPDADSSPEEYAGLRASRCGPVSAADLAGRGCRVVVPALIDRGDDWSGNPKLNRKTNIPHREFVYRMAYEMGRTPSGFEVQTVLAAVDWLAKQKDAGTIGVVGRGDGGRVALYAAALDERIAAAQANFAFGPREKSWREPIDRNLWRVLREFGDAEVGRLVAPRTLVVHPTGREKTTVEWTWPRWPGPADRADRGGAAPGVVEPLDTSAVRAEVERLTPAVKPMPPTAIREEDDEIAKFLGALGDKFPAPGERPRPTADKPSAAAEARRKRRFDQTVAYVQKLWRDSDSVRATRFAKCDTSSPQAWAKSTAPIRDFFWEEVIGKLPPPTLPRRIRGRRLIYDEPKWTGYEVTLDLYRRRVRLRDSCCCRKT